MANVKNFGLVGVGSDLQLGKAGVRIVNNTGTFNLKAANGSTDAALTAAGITSSAGNVTLTTGNLVLSENTGTIGIGGATLSRAAAGVLKFDGTSAMMVPYGTTAQQPTGAVGMLRANTDNGNSMEYYNGSAWVTLATGGSTGALQTEIDNIETSLGAGINTDGTFNAAGFTNNAALNNPTSFTNAIQQIANYADSKNTLDEIFPSLSAGNVIYSNGSNQWVQAAPGATSGVQGYDAGLAALAAKTTTGIMVQTGNDTYVSRSLVQPAAGLTIADADGVAGNPTFALANDLAALEGLTGTGFAVRTADDVWVERSISGSTGRIDVTNGNGVTASPTIDLATVTDSGAGTFLKVTVDTYGRVTGTQAVAQSDITSLVDSVYVNAAGDTMSGNLAMGGNLVTGLGAPVSAGDATNKGYVDALVSGLSWKQATKAATTGNITLSGEQTVDGVALVAGDRVLVKNQTDATENGIYVVAAGAWARSTDADIGTELDGAAVYVQQGSTNADSGWTQTTSNVTIGTSNIVWSQFSGSNAYIGGTGIDITGNTISVNLGAGIAQLPTDEVGIDLFDASTGALILTTDGSTRSTASGAQLYLMLDAAGGLGQTASGLKINAGGVTNTMLVNSGITLDADDVTTGSVSLGGTLLISGDNAQGVSTILSGSSYEITVQDATDTNKGVATFETGQFVVTAGNVELGTVPVANGGTGVTTFTATQVVFGSDTNTVGQDASFTFDKVGTGSDIPRLAVGGITVGSSDPTGNAVIMANQTNGDIVLVPNGSGSVVIGPVGAGLIESDAGTALTVRGNTGLTLDGGTGALTLDLPAGTSASAKVSVTGPTAADYATNLGNSDLVNKYYVDQAIQSGAASGSIKAVKATITLDNGTTNVGAALPAGATVLSVKVQVTSTDTAATLSVGISGDVAKYMTTAENDLQSTGIYLAETYAVEASSVQVIATVAGSGEAGGSATVFVEYQVA